jgi:hypothetical protein
VVREVSEELACKLRVDWREGASLGVYETKNLQKEE